MKITERWRHLRGDFVKHMAFGLLLIPLHSLLAVVASAAAVYFATTGRALIQQHPLSSVAAAVAAIPVIYLLYRGFVFRIRRHREYERIRQVAEGCGIEGFWGRTTRAEKEDGWRDCVGKIAAAGSSEILIAGLTGAATFARDDAPLHEVIHAHKGDVRILLIQKNSAAFSGGVGGRAVGAGPPFTPAPQKPPFSPTTSSCRPQRCSQPTASPSSQTSSSTIAQPQYHPA